MTLVPARLADAVGGRARLTVVSLLAGVLGLQGADLATVGASAVQLEAALDIGNTEVGLLVTVSAGIGALATLPVGLLADRVNRVRLLSTAIVVWSLAIVVCGASSSFTMLLLARVALGAVVATAAPVVASLTGDLIPAVDRGRIYGFILAGELLGGGFGFLVSGHVAALVGWRWAFWVLVPPGLALAYLVHRLLPEPARGGASRLEPGAETILSAEQASPAAGAAQAAGGDSDRPASEGAVEAEVLRRGDEPDPDRVLTADPAGRSLWWAVRYVLGIRTNRLLIGASALGNSFLSGVRTFAVVFLVAHFGVGPGTGSTLLVLLGAGSVLGVLTTGRLADHLVGRGHVDARLLVAAGAFGVGAVFFVPALLTGSLLVAAPLLVLSAAGVGGTNPPIDAARLDLMHSRLWGRAESVRTVLRSSLEAGAPLAFGYLSTRLGSSSQAVVITAEQVTGSGVGLQRAFLLSSVLLLVAAGLLIRARGSYARDVATAVASERRTAAT